MKGITGLGVATLCSLLAVIGVCCKDGSKPAAQNSSGAINIGKTESQNSLSSWTISSASDNAGFSSGHLMFMTESEHPLIARVMPHLTNALHALPQVERMEVMAAVQTTDVRPRAVLAEGSRAPDLFARLNLRSIEEEGALSKKVKVVMTCTLGTEPWQSSHHSGDYTTPPLVRLTWSATLDHETTFTGLHSDRDGVIAASVAADFSKGLTNLIQDMRQKHPALPPLPDHLYGSYIPVADLGFLKAVQAQRVSSHYGLFTHNRTFWKFQTSSNPVPQLEKIMDEMRAEGWTLDNSSLTNTMDYYISGTSGGATVEIFRPRESRSEPEDEGNRTSTDFVVHYRKPFSQSEIEASMDKLLSENTSMEVLLPFENSFTGSQRKRFYALLEKAEATTPHAYLSLANHYLARKETNAAVNMLTRAKAMSALLPNTSSFDSNLEAVTKKISPKSTLKLEPTASTYRDLGFVELTNSFAPTTFEKAFGSPMVVFYTATNGPHVLSVSARSTNQDQSQWTAIQRSTGMRSMITHSTEDSVGFQQTFSLDDLKLKLTAKPDKAKKRSNYVIEPAR